MCLQQSHSKPLDPRSNNLTEIDAQVQMTYEAPINRLPAELLGLVFIYTLDRLYHRGPTYSTLLGL